MCDSQHQCVILPHLLFCFRSSGVDFAEKLPIKQYYITDSILNKFNSIDLLEVGNNSVVVFAAPVCYTRKGLLQGTGQASKHGSPSALRGEWVNQSRDNPSLLLLLQAVFSTYFFVPQFPSSRLIPWKRSWRSTHVHVKASKFHSMFRSLRSRWQVAKVSRHSPSLKPARWSGPMQKAAMARDKWKLPY